MIWSKNVFAPGWFHPGAEDRDEIIPGQTHFCSKSCKHLQVNDQTPSWKSSRDEMQVIPGWNSSRDEITHVNGTLNRVAKWMDFVLNRVRVWRPWRHTPTQTSLKCPPGLQSYNMEDFFLATWKVCPKIREKGVWLCLYVQEFLCLCELWISACLWISPRSYM